MSKKLDPVMAEWVADGLDSGWLTTAVVDALGTLDGCDAAPPPSALDPTAAFAHGQCGMAKRLAQLVDRRAVAEVSR